MLIIKKKKMEKGPDVLVTAGFHDGSVLKKLIGYMKGVTKEIVLVFNKDGIQSNYTDLDRNMILIFQIPNINLILYNYSANNGDNVSIRIKLDTLLKLVNLNSKKEDNIYLHIMTERILINGSSELRTRQFNQFPIEHAANYTINNEILHLNNAVYHATASHPSFTKMCNGALDSECIRASFYENSVMFSTGNKNDVESSSGIIIANIFGDIDIPENSDLTVNIPKSIIKTLKGMKSLSGNGIVKIYSEMFDDGNNSIIFTTGIGYYGDLYVILIDKDDDK